jgi:hypothetical protein
MSGVPEYLDAASRRVALGVDKLRALQSEALRLTPLVRDGEIFKPDAVDALMKIASINDLCGTPEQRAHVELIVGNGLNGAPTLKPLYEPRQNQSAGKVPTWGRATQDQDNDELIVQNAADIVPEKIKWLWEGRVALGKPTTIAGDPGMAKSQVLLGIAAVVSTGGQWPCGEGAAPLGNVVLLCAEDGAADTIRPRLEAAGADLSRVTIVHGTRDKRGARGFDLQTDLEKLEKTIAQIGNVRLIGIDPVTAYMGSGVDSHKNAEVRRVLSPLAQLAERARVAVVTVTHFSKGNNGASAKALYRFIGSIAFTAAPRIAFLVTEDPEDKNRRLFLHVKNNLAKPPQGLAYQLEQHLVGDDRNILASAVCWDSQPVTITADEGLSGSACKAKLEDECVSFLRDLLSKGALPVREIEQHAVQLRLLSEGRPIGQSKPFRVARGKLNITTEKGGMHEGWRWSLPKVPFNPEGAH